jgi:nucleoside-diphosphate-sugar epimerase
MTAARHVIFGTGAIGLATLDALRRRSETVRLVNRSGHARVPDDVEVIGGDASDPPSPPPPLTVPPWFTRRLTRPTRSGRRSSGG